MRNVIAILTVLLLSGCLGAGAVGALLGGGPKVAANGQAGATNTQTLGQSNLSRPTVKNSTVGTLHQTGTSKAGATIEHSGAVTVNQMPWWVIPGWILTAFFCWKLPSDREVRSWFQRKT